MARQPQRNDFYRINAMPDNVSVSLNTAIQTANKPFVKETAAASCFASYEDSLALAIEEPLRSAVVENPTAGFYADKPAAAHKRSM